MTLMAVQEFQRQEGQNRLVCMLELLCYVYLSIRNSIAPLVPVDSQIKRKGPSWNEASSDASVQWQLKQRTLHLQGYCRFHKYTKDGSASLVDLFGVSAENVWMLRGVSEVRSKPGKLLTRFLARWKQKEKKKHFKAYVARALHTIVKL